MNLNDIAKKYSEDVDAVNDWSNEIYDENFKCYFDGQRKLFERLKSKDRPITDTELEWILTQTPINLFYASEKLNNIQTQSEIIKLEVKHKQLEAKKASLEKSDTAKSQEAEDAVIEDKILLIAYDAILSRVDREMAYSRELIMSAKKIYDRRKGTEQSNPVSEIKPVHQTLPDYGKEYIK